MAIAVGDQVPAATLKRKTAEGISDVETGSVFDGKKVVLFSVPGAFTPTCSTKHLPGFVQQAAAIKDKGVDSIVCISVNDPFVMEAWEKDQGADGSVLLLADHAAEFTKSLGLDADLSAAGLGTRGKRFAMVVDQGKVTHLAVEESPGELEASSADAVLAAL